MAMQVTTARLLLVALSVHQAWRDVPRNVAMAHVEVLLACVFKDSPADGAGDVVEPGDLFGCKFFQ
ncbi:hypothetical protein SK128_013446 [Halocaridina rubra]|uniref:Secreted protein n=1 Tax=Halocaridina rubra TaxID=373956 RepID=A0AAN8X0G8_HALRR